MSTAGSDQLCVDLVASACRILEQSGESEPARVLSRLTLALEVPERWTLSGRTVDAHLAVLLVPGDLILRVRSDTALRDKFRAALAASFDTPSRVLRDLAVMLDDGAMRMVPADALSASHPYRDRMDPGALPHPAVLRRAAQSYANASGDGDTAELLSRSRVVVEPASTLADEGPTNVRISVLLGVDDLARLGRDKALRDRMRAAMRAVAQGPRRVVGEVTMGPDWSLPISDEPCAAAHAAQHAAQLLRDLLAAEGVASVVTSAGDQGIRLIASLDGQVGVVDVVDGPPAQSTLPVVHIRVDPKGHDLAEAARSIRKALQRLGET